MPKIAAGLQADLAPVVPVAGVALHRGRHRVDAVAVKEADSWRDACDKKIRWWQKKVWTPWGAYIHKACHDRIKKNKKKETPS